jgi:hypothetical protein
MKALKWLFAQFAGSSKNKQVCINLIDLSPLLRRFLRESFVNHWHYLVQELTARKASNVSFHVRITVYGLERNPLVVCTTCNLLHQCR